MANAQVLMSQKAGVGKKQLGGNGGGEGPSGGKKYLFSKTFLTTVLPYKRCVLKNSGVKCFSAKKAKRSTIPSHVVKGRSGEDYTVLGVSRAGFDENDQFERILVFNNLGSSKLDLASNSRKFLSEDCVQNNQRGVVSMPIGFNIALSNATVVEDQKWLGVKFVVDFTPDQAGGVEIGKFPVAVNFVFRKGFNSDGNNKSCLSLTFQEVETIVKHARPILKKWADLGSEINFDSPNDVPLPKDVILRETEKTDRTSRRIVIFSVSLLKKQTGSHSGAQEGSVVASIREYSEDTRRQMFVPTKTGICIGLRALYYVCFPVWRVVRAWHDAFLNLALTEQSLFAESQRALDEIESIVSKGLNLKEGQLHPLDKDELIVRQMEGYVEGDDDSSDEDDVSDEEFLNDILGVADADAVAAE